MTSGADSTGTVVERGEGLPLGVAVEMASALASTVAAQLGARSLIIKGAVASHYGLRAPRTSADADVLVHPPAHAGVVAALLALGWRERPMWTASAEANPYSASLIHDAWPCDIDVHARFPGFLKDSVEVFEHLWNDRSELEFAGVPCAIPGEVGAILVAALHGVRPSGSPERAAAELAAVGKVLDGADQDVRANVRALAEATGASGPLAAFLADHGVTVSYDLTPELRAWTVLTTGGATYTGNVASTLVGKPLRAKLHILRLAAWPSADDVRASYPDVADSASARTWARIKRLGRGAAQAPRAMAALAKSRPTAGEAHRDDAN